MMEQIGAALKMEVVLVSPEVAAAWLDVNVKNRPLSSSVVDKYARDMGAGRFPFTGDPIRFDSSGMLIDGQHRLSACVKAKTPFRTLVLYGLPPDAQSHMDKGKSRSAADTLALEGFHHARAIAAVARIMLDERYGRGQLNAAWSTAEIKAVLERHPQVHASARRVYAKNPPRSISAAQLAYVHTVASSILGMPERADEFVAVFVDGIPNYENDPAHLLRERLIRSATSSDQMKRREAFRGMKQAWNAFATRRPLKVLKWNGEVAIDGLDVEAL